MSTKTLVDDIVGLGVIQSRLKILSLIEKGQNALRDSTHPKMWYIGTDNQGFPPYLKTAAGTYRYTLNAENISSGEIKNASYDVYPRKILRVFIDMTHPTSGYGNAYLGVPYSVNYYNPYTNKTTRLQVADIPIDAADGNGNDYPTITFKEDPGTELTKYFVVFTTYAPRLLSESIPLVVPYRYEEAIEDYVCGIIAKRENGVIGQQLQYFNDYWKPEFARELMIGSSIFPTKTELRAC